MASSTNRNLAAKHAKGVSQRIDAGKAEYTKSAYATRKVSDGEALTVALVSRSDVVNVQGKDVRRVGMVSRSDTQTVIVGEEVLTRTVTSTKAQSMKQYLRSMF